jgi:hypothetical protein
MIELGVHDVHVIHVASLAKLMPGFEVADNEVPMRCDSPVVDLVDNGQEFPGFPFVRDTAAPDSLKDLKYTG